MRVDADGLVDGVGHVGRGYRAAPLAHPVGASAETIRRTLVTAAPFKGGVAKVSLTEPGAYKLGRSVEGTSNSLAAHDSELNQKVVRPTKAHGPSRHTIELVVVSVTGAAVVMLLVSVGGAAASFATVTGTATLTGGTVNAQFTGGVTRQYTILTAAGGLGGTTFACLTNTNLPAGFTEGGAR